MPLLRAEGDLRDTGALAIADCGRAALPAVKKELATADFHTKRVLYAILARLHSAESIHLLLEGFFDPNFEMVKAVSRELRSQIPALSPVERKAAGTATLTFLKSKPVQASRSAVNSCLIYLGHLGTVEAMPELLRRTNPDEPRAMRRHALHALRGVLQGGKAPVKVVETLFPYLDDPNFEDVVEPAMAVLERADLPAAYEKELERLIGGRTPQVRAFAVRKLAESPGKRAAEILVRLVDGPDEALRRSAVSALKNSPRARFAGPAQAPDREERRPRVGAGAPGQGARAEVERGRAQVAGRGGGEGAGCGRSPQRAAPPSLPPRRRQGLLQDLLRPRDEGQDRASLRRRRARPAAHLAQPRSSTPRRGFSSDC